MAQVFLCEGPVEVFLAGAGEDVTLSVKDGSEVSCRVRIAWLEAVLDGETIQISGSGRHCKLQARSSDISLNYSADGKLYSCKISYYELGRAIAMIKSEGSTKSA
jgi:hypothetical protein